MYQINGKIIVRVPGTIFQHKESMVLVITMESFFKVKSFQE